MNTGKDTEAQRAVEGDAADGAAWIEVGYVDPPAAPVGHKTEVRRCSHLGTVDAYRHVPRLGEFMQTFTGKAIYPMDLRVEDVDIRDIAHSLSMLCRYAGHTKNFYSVGEHSVRVARWCRQFGPEAALHGLLHDATEAYLVDVPRPIKPYLVGYREAEQRAWDVIVDRYSIVLHTPVIEQADRRILADERSALMAQCEREWADNGQPLGVQIEGWLPARAEREFLALFDELYGED